MGHYQILKRLAVGGMAEIFLARSTAIKGFEKHVVLKRILPNHAQSDDFVTMFLDEARLAARLTHRNIGQVYDFGEQNGDYYLVMEYLHGQDVQSMLKSASKKQKSIPLKHVLNIVSNVAAGLQYAHDQVDSDGAPLHIVHRDVAPSNIIVTYDGAVKLVDFGIATAQTHNYETDAGLIKGKISYMSPEQIRGKELDGRTDIFTLGIVLYELTTMSRLFPIGREHKLTVMRRIVQGKIPRPSRRVYPYPPRLEKIVMRALSVERSHRYQNAGELVEDIERFAKRQNLSLSPTELGRYVTQLTGYRPEPWRRVGNSDDGEADARDGEAAVSGERSDEGNLRLSLGVPMLHSATHRSVPRLPADSSGQERTYVATPRSETVRVATLQRQARKRRVIVLVAVMLAGVIGAIVALLSGHFDSPLEQRPHPHPHIVLRQPVTKSGIADAEPKDRKELVSTVTLDSGLPDASDIAQQAAPPTEVLPDDSATPPPAADGPVTNTGRAGRELAKPERKRTATKSKRDRKSRSKSRRNARRSRSSKESDRARSKREKKANARQTRQKDRPDDANWDSDDVFPPSTKP